MKIITEGNEYIKTVKLPNGKFVMEVGDKLDGYNIVLTKQEIEKVIEMLQEEIKIA